MERGTARFDSVVSRGNTSDVYAVGVDAVVKVPRPYVPDHWIEVEALHAAAVHEAGLPTPMVLDMLDVDGRRAIVFERVDGPSMLERLAVSPDSAEALARDMASIQRQLHASPAPDGLPEQRERVAGKIESAGSVTARERSTAQEVLEGLSSGSSVCHGDLHPGNILLGDQGPMVIDWFDATAGLPVADMVRSSLLIRPLSSSSSSPHLPGVTMDTLECFHRAYVGSMCEGLEVDNSATLSWEAVLAVSRLAEPLQAGIDDLLSVWQRRADLSLEPVTPLAELLLADSSEE